MDFGVVFDGDGDCNMIIGLYCYVFLFDSLVILVDFVYLVFVYKDGLVGVVWLMLIFCVVDCVVVVKGMESFEMLIGWKFFGNLLDVGCVMFCGEESVGIGLDYVCEKDGFWVVFLWLNIFVVMGKLMD